MIIGKKIEDKMTLYKMTVEKNDYGQNNGWQNDYIKWQ